LLLFQLLLKQAHALASVVRALQLYLKQQRVQHLAKHLLKVRQFQAQVQLLLDVKSQALSSI
jgi:hypothetical protein